MSKLTRIMLGLPLLAGLLILPSAAQDVSRSVLKSGSHCVAWKTKKTLALVRRAEATGINCNIQVKAVKSGDKLGAEVTIPIASFNSNEKDRDKEVQKILKANVQPNLIFKTEMLTAATWKNMMGKGSGPVKGTLKIGGKNYPVSTVAKVAKAAGGYEVYGAILTKYTAFGLQPPVVGPGGSIAKVDNYLELHFNFHSSKLQNRNLVPGL